MSGVMRKSVLVVLLVAITVFAVASAAAAMSVTNTYDKGTTTRTIWDTSQVACYKLPHGVNHIGNIHMELSFKPNWADLDVYLLNADGDPVGGVDGEQGYLASFTGREVIDLKVEEIINTTVTGTGDDTDVVGDDYYVLIVAFNETAKFRVDGYYPMNDDPAASTSTTDAYNYYLQNYRMPAGADTWKTIAGPRYGYPYDFMPTSVGKVSGRLEWPADVENKVVEYTQADFVAGVAPAAWESYLYFGDDWDTVWENYSVDGTWKPRSQEGGTWFGLLNPGPKDPQGTTKAGDFTPMNTFSYVPSLYVAAADPAMGVFGGPALGITTMGMKATLTYPENLRIASAPRTVRKGNTVVVKGTFALNGAWAPGVKVTLQRKGATGGWKNFKTATTDANGMWKVSFTATSTARYQASAPGAGDVQLDTELSGARRITVH